MSALLNRLIYHYHTLIFIRKSYRLEHSSLNHKSPWATRVLFEQMLDF